MKVSCELEVVDWIVALLVNVVCGIGFVLRPSSIRCASCIFGLVFGFLFERRSHFCLLIKVKVTRQNRREKQRPLTVTVVSHQAHTQQARRKQKHLLKPCRFLSY